MQLLLALGNDGILREYDWRGINDISTGFLKEEVIEDAVATGDGKYFATLSKGQTEINLYSYQYS